MIRKSKHPTRAFGPRGSVSLIALVILMVMSLIAITLTYLAHTETYSSRNWQEGLQTRIAVFTGLDVGGGGGIPPIGPRDEFGAAKASGARPIKIQLSVDELFNVEPIAPPDAEGEEAEDEAAVADGATIPETHRAQFDLTHLTRTTTEDEDQSNGKDPSEVRSAARMWPWKVRNNFGAHTIEDESAKININALVPSPEILAARTVAGSGTAFASSDFKDAFGDEAHAPPAALTEDDLAAFIATALELRGLGTEVSPAALARAIVARRYGPDGQPGAASIDDNANSGQADPAEDGVDNDGDYFIDNVEESVLGTEFDGLDNNRDGRIDEPGEGIGDDGIDNDGNGRIDDDEEAIDEAAEFDPDIRVPPAGDDRPFTRIEDLLTIPGMSREIFDVISPNLTVFSISRRAYASPIESDTGYAQIDPNTATAEDIFAALTTRYGELPEELLGQFTVNILDRRDPDSEPTVAYLGSASAEPYVGLELTPYISEVYANASTDEADGDDGQYFEIVNPHNNLSFDLSGWRIEGAGVTVWLSGDLNPGDILLVTDDYDESNDPDPEDEPGFGSLYDIFGVAANGMTNRIQVVSLMNLNDFSGKLTLYDKDDVAVDEFSWTGAARFGHPWSFQRLDPRRRNSMRPRMATPLMFNTGSPRSCTDESGTRMQDIGEQLHNQPFNSPLELLLVSTAYVTPAALEITSEYEPIQIEQWCWQYPTLEGESRDELANLSVDVVDLFMPGAPSNGGRERARAMMMLARIAEAPGGDLDEELATIAIEMEWRSRLAAPRPAYGRINLNSASPAVIAALPGVDLPFAWRIDALRNAWLTGQSAEDVLAHGPQIPNEAEARRRFLANWYRSIPPSAPSRWRGLSEFLLDEDLWEDASLIERISKSNPFSRLVTFHTLSLKVTSEATSPKVANKNRRTRTMRSQRLVAADRGRIETFGFHYVYPPVSPENDPDLRFASLDSSNRDIAANMIARAEAQALAVIEMLEAERDTDASLRDYVTPAGRPEAQLPTRRSFSINSTRN